MPAKNKIWSILIWSVIGIGIAVLIFFKIQAKNPPKPGNSGGGSPEVLVKGYIVKTQNIENAVLATGTLLAMDEMVVKPEISGKIVSIGFKEGATVSKGQLLVKMFDSDLQASKAKLELQLKLAETTEGRLKELLAKQGVSQQEYDAALNLVLTYKAEIDLLNAQISKTEIRAPFNGKIGLQQISVGSMVSPTDVIATLQQTAELKVDFSIPEKYLPLLGTGAQIDFKVEGFDENFQATVYAIEPKIELNSRTIQIRAKYLNKGMKLLPGSFASIQMPLEEIQNGIMIPTESIIPEIRGQKIFRAKNGKAEPLMIQTGVRNDSLVQVLNDLHAGDTIVTTGMMRLQPGSALKFTQTR